MSETLFGKRGNIMFHIAAISHVTPKTPKQKQVIQAALSDVVLGFHFSWNRYVYQIKAISYERFNNAWLVEYHQVVYGEDGKHLHTVPTSFRMSPKQVTEAYQKIKDEYK